MFKRIRSEFQCLKGSGEYSSLSQDKVGIAMFRNDNVGIPNFERIS